MLAVFLGGPKHGRCEEMDTTPARVTEQGEDGTHVVYVRMGEDADGVGHRELVTRRVYYAPSGTSIEDYHKLWKDALPNTPM